MQIKVARCSGFCFGVQRAIDIAESALKELKGKKYIYSLGPIIHNPQVVEALSKKGLYVIDNVNRIKNGVILISSHGAPVSLVQRIKKKNIKLIDATCPFVKEAQRIVAGLKKHGYKIIIVGDNKHPEVKALRGIAGKGINSKKIGIVSQTTQNKDNYIKEISEVLKGDFSEARIFNTICKDTSERQTLTKALLKECDLMLIIGGRNSANTKRLWQICKESGVDSFHIETESELDRRQFVGKRSVGLTSGASTPDWVVKKVVERIKTF